MTATVSDGRSETYQVFTLRAVADKDSIQPDILVNLTPQTPILPGQLATSTIRAQSYAAIASVTVQARGAGIGASDWQTVELDNAGRLRLTPAYPGLVELQVTATDIDGFSHTTTERLRVKDPADTSAPLLQWTGALQGLQAGSTPLRISYSTAISARLQDTQLMGYRLEIAPSVVGQSVQSLVWQSLGENDYAAQAIDAQTALATLDPHTLNNGVYQLRLTAWDLAGRSTTQMVSLLIDSSEKTQRVTTTDSLFSVGNHTLALTREMMPGSTQQDAGNWRLPLLDSQLTHDQALKDATGATAPWRQGTNVWLQLPTLANNDQAAVNLSFSLGLEPLGNNLYRPVFSQSQGWQLSVGDLNAQSVQLTLQGGRLYNAATGLAWVPSGFVATDKVGNRYQLSAQGKLSQVVFNDNTQWLVSDSGVTLVGDATQQARVQLIRDDKGRIERIVGMDSQGQLQSIVYRYDAQGQLVTARSLVGDSVNQRYGYQTDGSLLTAQTAGYLGAAVNWGDTTQNTWQGTLTATPTYLTFGVRESELASTRKAPGSTGSVIVAVHSTGNASVGVDG
ncbi:hypothetical protein ACGTJS_04815 [Faucicola mancuniensis]|uniref:hypothetical protein n=1 Tax=Faucicola mancuniensis TaxID=1309795 RepID=UPI003977DA93